MARPPTTIYTLSLHDALPIFSTSASVGRDRDSHAPILAAAGAGVNGREDRGVAVAVPDRKSTRLNSSHMSISYAVFCLKKKINIASGTDEYDQTQLRETSSHL